MSRFYPVMSLLCSWIYACLFTLTEDFIDGIKVEAIIRLFYLLLEGRLVNLWAIDDV